MKSSKHFCIIPWLHIHGLPNGNVMPCCVSDFDRPYGDLNKTSLSDIWNNSKYKTMRRLMLADKAVHNCRGCYELEESGVSSMRTRMNQLFNHDEELIKQTEDTGEHKNLKMKYLDFRFSNICNFKCRGCSPTLSTKWYEDHNKLWDYKSEKPKYINITKDKPIVWDDLKKQLPYVEVAYFAGGEPLLMDEHYECLNFLIDNNKTDVALAYNSNLSILKHKDYDLVKLWSHFKKIDLGISLDEIEKRGEYFRSGLNWENLNKNIETIMQALPNVSIQVNCTISMFNIARIPQIHSYLFAKGIIDEYGFIFNTLQDPVRYRTQILPKDFKESINKNLNLYLELLKDKHPDKDWSHFESGLVNQLNFMNAEDYSYMMDEFKKVTLKLDKIRNESFTETFPEMANFVS